MDDCSVVSSLPICQFSFLFLVFALRAHAGLCYIGPHGVLVPAGTEHLFIHWLIDIASQGWYKSATQPWRLFSGHGCLRKLSKFYTNEILLKAVQPCNLGTSLILKSHCYT